MRNLPKKPNEYQKTVIKAVRDFWGDGSDVKDRSIINTALWIMGRRARIELTEQEKEAVWYIQENLKDEIYRKNLETDK